MLYANTFSFDVDHLKRLIAYRHISKEELSRKTGHDRKWVGRLLSTGKGRIDPSEISTRSLVRLANALNVYPEVFLPRHDPWEEVDINQQPEKLNEHISEMAHARTILSLTRQTSNFFMPEPLYLLAEESQFRARGYDEQKVRERLQHAKLLHVARQSLREMNDRYQLKVIAPDTALRVAKERNPEWLATMRGMFGAHRDDTAAAFVSPEIWKTINGLIHRHLLNVDWDKINVADSVFCCVICADKAYYTYDPTTVETARTLIEEKVPALLAGGFPGPRSSLYDLREYNERALRTFNNQWCPEFSQGRTYLDHVAEEYRCMQKGNKRIR